MGSLIIEDLQEGFGKEAVKGKEITVHYTGWLENGTKFDSSLDRRQPLTITLGVGQVRRLRRHEGRRQTQADHPFGNGLRRTRCRRCDSPARHFDI